MFRTYDDWKCADDTVFEPPQQWFVCNECDGSGEVVRGVLKEMGLGAKPEDEPEEDEPEGEGESKSFSLGDMLGLGGKK